MVDNYSMFTVLKAVQQLKALPQLTLSLVSHAFLSPSVHA